MSSGLGVGRVVLAALLTASFPYGAAPSAAAPAEAAAERVVVRITDQGLDPADVTASLGELEIVWRNESRLPRRVTESGFRLFDSGRLLPGEEFSYSPRGAGTFAYQVDVDPSLGLDEFRSEGSLEVMPSAHVKWTRRTPGNKIRWALPAPPSHMQVSPSSPLAFDVQWGSAPDLASHVPSKWRWWHSGTNKAGDHLAMECSRSYHVRVRMRDPASGARSKWSPSPGPLWVCIY